MAKQVKTNAKDVKAKQEARAPKGANGAAKDHPVEQYREAVTIQACADALLAMLTERGTCTEKTVVAELTDHKKHPELWTKTAVDKAIDLLAKENEILCFGPAENPMVRLFDAPHEGEEDEAESAPEPDHGEDDEPEEAAPLEPLKTYEYRPTRYLLHVFTPEEINSFRADGEEKDRVYDELDALLDGHKEAARALTKRMDLLHAERRALSKKVRDGSEYKNVPCEERKEIDGREAEPTFGQLMMFTYRLDTNEVIEVRELKGAERQGILFQDAPAKTPASGNEFRETPPDPPAAEQPSV